VFVLVEGLLVDGVLDVVVEDGLLVFVGLLVSVDLFVSVGLLVVFSSLAVEALSVDDAVSLELSSVVSFTFAPQCSQKETSFEMPSPQLKQYFSIFLSLPQADKENTITIAKTTAKILLIAFTPI
jgi:hypothetical protein